MYVRVSIMYEPDPEPEPDAGSREKSFSSEQEFKEIEVIEKIMKSLKKTFK